MTPTHLAGLADRVARLNYDHRDPERFHVEKNEIEMQLRVAAEKETKRVR